MAAVIKVKIDDIIYEVEKLTLGETWLLQRDYGVKDVENPSNAFGAYVGLLAIAMRRGDPSLTEAQARAKVEALDDERIEIIKEDKDESEFDPKDTATAKGSGKSPKSGKPAKTPASAGAGR